MKKLLNIFILLIFTALAFVSCHKKQHGDIISHEFKAEQWGRFDYLESDFNVMKAPMMADIVMDIEVSDMYPDNDFVIVLSINAPDGGRRAREFKFKLKDADGNFKSQKLNGYYHFSLPLINEMSFSEVGNYHFKIENKYPKEPLCGIKSLNVNCLQIKRF